MHRLRTAVEKVRNAKEGLLNEMRVHFKIGDTIKFSKGRGNITAEILRVGRGRLPEIYIRSHTGKEYWVSLYDVTGFYGY